MTFSATLVVPPSQTQAQPLLNLPLPGTMVPLSPGFTPALMKGLKIHADNPLKFDFMIDSGDSGLQGDDLKGESRKLVKYFLASLATPEEDLWVNLSPYEKDRIIPDEFGVTEMGRDLLAQDYLLKQLTASLVYPEEELGKKFWDRVKQKALQLYGVTDIPVSTFNKVWIVPEKAVVYENKDTVFITETHLKVMLEEDYLAMSHQKDMEESQAPARGLAQQAVSGDQISGIPAISKASPKEGSQLSTLSSEIIREVILPEIEKEVNEGENFASLRQIYSALVLAVWFKQALKESLLGKVYVDQKKIAGVDVNDKDIKEKIYQQYVEAYKKGVYNYIKEDVDPRTKELIPRKYFSGGLNLKVPLERRDMAMLAEVPADSLQPAGTRYTAEVALAEPDEVWAAPDAVVPAVQQPPDVAMLGGDNEQPVAHVWTPDPMVQNQANALLVNAFRDAMEQYGLFDESDDDSYFDSKETDYIVNNVLKKLNLNIDSLPVESHGWHTEIRNTRLAAVDREWKKEENKNAQKVWVRARQRIQMLARDALDREAGESKAPSDEPLNSVMRDQMLVAQIFSEPTIEDRKAFILLKRAFFDLGYNLERALNTPTGLGMGRMADVFLARRLDDPDKRVVIKIDPDWRDFLSLDTEDPVDVKDPQDVLRSNYSIVMHRDFLKIVKRLQEVAEENPLLVKVYDAGETSFFSYGKSRLLSYQVLEHVVADPIDQYIRENEDLDPEELSVHIIFQLRNFVDEMNVLITQYGFLYQDYGQDYSNVMFNGRVRLIDLDYVSFVDPNDVANGKALELHATLISEFVHEVLKRLRAAAPHASILEQGEEAAMEYYFDHIASVQDFNPDAKEKARLDLQKLSDFLSGLVSRDSAMLAEDSARIDRILQTVEIEQGDAQASAREALDAMAQSRILDASTEAAVISLARRLNAESYPVNAELFRRLKYYAEKGWISKTDLSTVVQLVLNDHRKSLSGEKTVSDPRSSDPAMLVQVPTTSEFDLVLGHQIGSTNDSEVFEIDWDGTPAVFKKFRQKGEQPPQEFVEAELAALARAGDVQFEGKRFVPKILARVTDASGILVGYIQTRAAGQAFKTVLRDFLIGKSDLTPREMLEIYRQLKGKIESLHARSVYHGDLNLGNIFVAIAGDIPDVTIIDFGLSRDARTPDLDRFANISNEILDSILFYYIRNRGEFYSGLEEESRRLRTEATELYEAINAPVSEATGKDVDDQRNLRSLGETRFLDLYDALNNLRRDLVDISGPIYALAEDIARFNQHVTDALGGEEMPVISGHAAQWEEITGAFLEHIKEFPDRIERGKADLENLDFEPAQRDAIRTRIDALQDHIRRFVESIESETVNADYRAFMQIKNTNADPAMLGAGDAIYPKNTASGRNHDVVELATSPLFVQKTGLDLSRGEHQVVNIGVGAIPFDTSDLATVLRLSNPNVHVIGTELPSAVAKAHIRFPEMLNAFRERIALELRNGKGLPVNISSLHDLILVVDSNDQVSEAIVGFRVGAREFYVTFAIARGVNYLGVSGRLQEAAVHNSGFLAELIRYFGTGVLERLIKTNADARTVDGIEIEFNPTAKALDKVGAKFIVTDDLQKEGIRNISLITANHVTVYMTAEQEKSFMDMALILLKENGILLIKDEFAASLEGARSTIRVFQRRNNDLQYLGELQADKAKKIDASVGWFSDNFLYRASLVDDLLSVSRLDDVDKEKIWIRVWEEFSDGLRFAGMTDAQFLDLVGEVVRRLAAEARIDLPDNFSGSLNSAPGRVVRSDPAMLAGPVDLFAGNLRAKVVVSKNGEYSFVRAVKASQLSEDEELKFRQALLEMASNLPDHRLALSALAVEEFYPSEIYAAVDDSQEKWKVLAIQVVEYQSADPAKATLATWISADRSIRLVANQILAFTIHDQIENGIQQLDSSFTRYSPRIRRSLPGGVNDLTQLNAFLDTNAKELVKVLEEQTQTNASASVVLEEIRENQPFDPAMLGDSQSQSAVLEDPAAFDDFLVREENAVVMRNLQKILDWRKMRAEVVQKYPGVAEYMAGFYLRFDSSTGEILNISNENESEKDGYYLIRMNKDGKIIVNEDAWQKLHTLLRRSIDVYNQEFEFTTGSRDALSLSGDPAMLGGDFHSAGNLIGAVNKVFYTLNKQSVFGFRTEEVLTPRNAKATAQELYQRLQMLKFEDRLPPKIVVQEWGVGRGTFMIEFLLALSNLDEDSEFIDRFEYQAWDISDNVLQIARTNWENMTRPSAVRPRYAGLSRIVDKVVFHQIDLSKDLPVNEVTPVLVRFEELYDDIDGVEIVEKTTEGWNVMQYSPSLSDDVVIETQAGRRISSREFINEYLLPGDLEKLQDIKDVDKLLSQITYEERRVPLAEYADADAGDLQEFIAEIDRLAFVGTRMPVNIGAFRNLSALIRSLGKDGTETIVQFFDYGFDINFPRSTVPMSTFEKGYGGHLTVGVNFYYFRHMMKKYFPDLSFEVVNQLDYQRRVLGKDLGPIDMEIGYEQLFQFKTVVSDPAMLGSAVLEILKDDSLPVIGADIPIPEGWTYVAHGSNLLNPEWQSHPSPFESRIFVVDNTYGLSVMSREERLIPGNEYPSAYTSPHSGRSLTVDEIRQSSSKRLEMRILMPKVELKPSYTEFPGLVEGTYLARAIPDKTELVQIAHTQINDLNVFYYVPREIINTFQSAWIQHWQEKSTSDTALLGSDKLGGIDFNPARVNLQIKRDGQGIALPVELQDIRNINIQGLTPVIINIIPVTNFPLFLGFDQNEDALQVSSLPQR